MCSVMGCLPSLPSCELLPPHLAACTSYDEEERLTQRNKLENDLEVASERMDMLVESEHMHTVS